MRRADRKRTYLPRLDVRNDRRHRSKAHLDVLAADQVGERRSAAFVRNMDELYAGRGLEQLSGELRHGAGTGRGIIKLAGLRPCEGDELGDGRGRHRRVYDEDNIPVSYTHLRAHETGR